MEVGHPNGQEEGGHLPVGGRNSGRGPPEFGVNGKYVSGSLSPLLINQPIDTNRYKANMEGTAKAQLLLSGKHEGLRVRSG